MNGLLERLTSPLDPDAFLELLGPLHTRRCQGVVASVTPLTPESAEIVMNVGRAWPGHVGGQFVTVGVDIDGVRHTRCYSLTSAPAAVSDAAGRGTQISIAVRAKPGGLVSQHLVHAVRPGAVVQLGSPEGDFTLASASLGRVLMVTGGSGVTPVMGMLRSLAGSPQAPPYDVTVIHHGPTRDEVMFGGELEVLGREMPWLTVHVRTTRTEAGGHLNAAVLDDLCHDWAERDVFVCGPAPLIDTVTRLWTDVDAAERVHVERFGPPPVDADVSTTSGAATGGTVTFAASGRDAAAPGDTTLLAVAEQAGLVPEAGCRMGICRTCTTPLLSGCVTDLRNGRRSEAGSHVQVCVSAADGDVTLDL
jgi:ferredoxin-NADP reductase